MSATQPVVTTGFDSFGLHPDLARGVAAAGFTNPRPIQAQTIPAALEGDDVLGLAQTGTGKTAAFALPLLDDLLRDGHRGLRALVVAPTRELATQIDAEIQLLAKYTKLRTALVFGGVSIGRQVAALRRQPDLVVACPGRLLDLMRQGALRLDGIRTLVLDEADHMFDMGFLPDIRRILEALPKDRQNLLFSATMPREIRRLADEILYEPHVVELTVAGPAETIEHALYPVAETRKRDLLHHILESGGCASAIVFTRTKHRARRLGQQLDKAGYRAASLQGNMSQAQRDRTMKGFRERRFDILVATDIAARGIDVSGISHVINYDVPNTPEAYTHRIGRTGRSEVEGTACTFVTSGDWDWVKATERMIGTPIPQQQVEGFTEVARASAPRSNAKAKPSGRPNGGSRGPRGRRWGGNGRGRKVRSIYA